MAVKLLGSNQKSGGHYIGNRCALSWLNPVLGLSLEGLCARGITGTILPRFWREIGALCACE
ncbi:hypothetical protein D0C16_15450 [Cellvibrio sp. KY-GH-1]|nr:hypothetical protein D0C16_15450 [Cellvibrio sp. KY-GH-1]